MTAIDASADEETTSSDLRTLGELAALAGVVKFPVRIKCATLAWNTLAKASRRFGLRQSTYGVQGTGSKFAAGERRIRRGGRGRPCGVDRFLLRGRRRGDVVVVVDRRRRRGHVGVSGGGSAGASSSLPKMLTNSCCASGSST